MQELIKNLTDNGPDAVQRNLSQDIKNAFRESLKGNKDNAIKKRVHGEDELSSRYLGMMKSMVSRNIT